MTFDYQMEFVGNKKIPCFCGSSNCSGKIGEKPKETDKKKAIKKKPKRKSSTGGKGEATKKPKGVDPIVAMLNKMGRKNAVKIEPTEQPNESADATMKEETAETPQVVEMQENKDLQTNEEGKEPLEEPQVVEMQENKASEEIETLLEGQIIDEREFIENLSPNSEDKQIEVSKNPLAGLSAVVCPSEADVKSEPAITMEVA